MTTLNVKLLPYPVPVFLLPVFLIHLPRQLLRATCSTCFLVLSQLKQTDWYGILRLTENAFCWRLAWWTSEISEVKSGRSGCCARQRLAGDKRTRSQIKLLEAPPFHPHHNQKTPRLPQGGAAPDDPCHDHDDPGRYQDVGGGWVQVGVEQADVVALVYQRPHSHRQHGPTCQLGRAHNSNQVPA